MEDPIIMADQQLQAICRERNIQPTDELRAGFRLGFMAGSIHQMDKVIAESSARLGVPA